MKNIVSVKKKFKVEIEDPAKGKVTFDYGNAALSDDFVKVLNKEGNTLKCYKIYDIEAAINASGYTYKMADGYESDFSSKNGWVYCLTIDRRIVKIGMTEVTLKSRFSSYCAGTLKARQKGTCSVTNYYCSETIRTCLRAGNKVEVFAWHAPDMSVEIMLFGNPAKALAKTAYLYEDAWMSLYEKINGSKPALCRNTSKSMIVERK